MVDIVADMEVNMGSDMGADMEVDMVADMEVDTILTRFHNFVWISQFWPN